MLPLTLLQAAQNQIMLVELKNGETYNGILVSCDTWMNINLREVVCTSRDGDRFWRMNECYVRGSMIKCMRMPDEVIEQVKEVQKPRQQNRTHDQRRDGKRPAPNHRQNNKPGGYKQQRTNNQRNQPVDGQ